MPPSLRPRSFKTKNINPRGGFRVTGEKYGPMRRAMLAVVPRSQSGVTFNEMVGRLQRRVSRKLFPHRGSVMWYAKVVQLDLEKRGLLRRVPGRVPQRLRRAR